MFSGDTSDILLYMYKAFQEYFFPWTVEELDTVGDGGAISADWLNTLHLRAGGGGSPSPPKANSSLLDARLTQAPEQEGLVSVYTATWKFLRLFFC